MAKQVIKLSFLFLFTVVMTAFKPDAGTLFIQIQNLDTNKGCIRLAIYDKEEGFLQEEGAIAGKTILLSSPGQIVTAEMSDLRFGKYALAIYHDIDGNGLLNTNFLGIPTEPYGFSNNPHVKWRSPRFREARFEFNENGQVMRVTLRRWKER